MQSDFVILFKIIKKNDVTFLVTRSCPIKGRVWSQCDAWERRDVRDRYFVLLRDTRMSTNPCNPSTVIPRSKPRCYVLRDLELLAANFTAFQADVAETEESCVNTCKTYTYIRLLF